VCVTDTFDLSERKVDATVQRQALTMRKLDDLVAATPVCQGAAQAVVALSDASSGVLPSCLPVNSSEDVMRPLISTEIGTLITDSLPDQITYSDVDLRAQLGSESLETLREVVIESVIFTDDDLVEAIAGGNDPQAVADAREMLDIVRAGIVFEQTDITDNLSEVALAQFNEVRDYIGRGWNFRWIIFLPVLLMLVGVDFIGGRGWPGRAKWAGAPVAAVAILFFAVI
jgi:hypothetical protein